MKVRGVGVQEGESYEQRRPGSERLVLVPPSCGQEKLKIVQILHKPYLHPGRQVYVLLQCYPPERCST